MLLKIAVPPGTEASILPEFVTAIVPTLLMAVAVPSMAPELKTSLRLVLSLASTAIPLVPDAVMEPSLRRCSSNPETAEASFPVAEITEDIPMLLMTPLLSEKTAKLPPVMVPELLTVPVAKTSPWSVPVSVAPDPIT
ncbi:hypothetical protein S23_43670 [Bradyrhizobium cosmicum]|uniref:Uncharacterized protein n=1 Tax=Bradyrhizobium cosmicum TaxID=1404864 RepID=A0AAI8QDK7_9BRAD|nr:hypothetical protein S23_43670 [Bradyrhizobium cosmicum]